MKGILLAGGHGTRLYPVTLAVSKQLLPIYDKPMFYYPLATLMEAGIREVLVISNPNDLPAFATLLGDGSALGMEIRYAAQPFAVGIADALRIGRGFAKDERVALILGDNLFLPAIDDGGAFAASLAQGRQGKGAIVYAVPVEHPQEFGVVEIADDGRVLSLEEKPAQPRSQCAVPGLYFYPPGVSERVEQLRPSARGELEITDLNRTYLETGELSAIALPESTRWLDTGTVSGLLAAINLVADRAKSGQHLGCIEQVAARQGWISAARLAAIAGECASSDYGRRLLALSEEASDV